MNPITQFLHDKLMPDLSSPAELSLPQAILLEHAKDLDAIEDLIANSNKQVPTEVAESIKEIEVLPNTVQKPASNLDTRTLN